MEDGDKSEEMSELSDLSEGEKDDGEELEFDQKTRSLSSFFKTFVNVVHCNGKRNFLYTFVNICTFCEIYGLCR